MKKKVDANVYNYMKQKLAQKQKEKEMLDAEVFILQMALDNCEPEERDYRLEAAVLLRDKE